MGPKQDRIVNHSLFSNALKGRARCVRSNIIDGQRTIASTIRWYVRRAGGTTG
jgi:hypothetical protein